MDDDLIVVNDNIELKEEFDVGGDIGCYIACVGGCLVTQMIIAPMAVATMVLN